MINRFFSWPIDFVLGTLASDCVCVHGEKNVCFHRPDEDISGTRGLLDGPQSCKDLLES